MIRRISYPSAATAFVFTGLWFVLGALLLWSPIPSALGIRGAMFVAWLVLFLLLLATAGAMLTMAAINGLFPPRRQPRPKPAPEPRPRATATHTADGKPQPWTHSPLPDHPSRPSASGTRRTSASEPPARPGP